MGSNKKQLVVLHSTSHLAQFFLSPTVSLPMNSIHVLRKYGQPKLGSFCLVKKGHVTKLAKKDSKCFGCLDIYYLRLVYY